MGFPGGSDGKESACNSGDLGLIWLYLLPIINFEGRPTRIDPQFRTPVPWWFGESPEQAQFLLLSASLALILKPRTWVVRSNNFRCAPGTLTPGLAVQQWTCSGLPCYLEQNWSITSVSHLPLKISLTLVLTFSNCCAFGTKSYLDWMATA